VRYLNALFADEFTSIDVAVVDAMIYDHQESFQKVAHLPVCVRAPCVYLATCHAHFNIPCLL
jgi:hypothetical protein